MEDLAKQFHEKALDVYERGKKLCGYNAVRFLQKVRRDGGVNAAKSWLSPQNINKLPTAGFMKLVAVGRLDISLEALVLRLPWNQLFTAEELAVARARLAQYGSNEVELQDHIVERLTSEELDTSEEFTEGPRKTITINAYERNRTARLRCIEHFGTRCQVCDFSFGSVYGPRFQNFIHVHHLRPLSTITETYQLDPVRDLVPVCPNCHAIIHQKEPPYTIYEMKKLINPLRKHGQKKLR